MKTFIPAFAIALLTLAACSEPRKLAPAPETIFHEQGLRVITSFYNQQSGTISLLYGNDDALLHAGKPRSEHIPGEVLKLVTWALKGNPLWFGSNINGDIRSVETVRILSASKGTTYEHEQHGGKTGSPAMAPGDSTERISFIFAQRASVFP